MADHRPASDYPPARIDPPATPTQAGLTTLAVAVVVVAALYLGRSVLLPVTLALLLSFVLAPLASLLRRLYLGRVLSVLIAVLLGLGTLLAISGLIGLQIAELAQDVPYYVTTIEQKIGTLRGLTLDRVSAFINDMSSHAPIAPPAEPAAPPQASEAAATPKPIPVEVHQPDPTAVQIAESILGPVVEPLSTTAIVFIVTIFVLLQREDLRDRMIRLFGSADLHRTTVAMNDAARRLSRYFLAQLGINATFGAVIGLGLFLIGLPSPVLWGAVALLMRFVPYIGAPLAALLPMILAAGVDPGWSMLLWTAALFAVSELIVSQVMEPLLYGHSTGLSPFSVVVAATFWTWLWGPIGLILSTPLTLCLVVLGRHVDRLEFLEVLLGDRPALTPVESFYQRMLSGDPDEAHDQAEQLLKDRPLSAYYDEVAIPGLRLAVADAARGVLTPVQMHRVQDSMMSLIEDLDDHDDDLPAPAAEQDDTNALFRREASPPPRDPPPGIAPPPEERPERWRSQTPVLCIAGRGPMDEVAAAMLVQLLRKHGLGADVLPQAVATRTGIVALNPTGVAMICVCSVEVRGTPSHLRFALRRLRQRAPEAMLLAGLWTPDDPVPRDDARRATLGADLCAVTLTEAVEACLAAASGEMDDSGGAEQAPMRRAGTTVARSAS